MNFVIEIDDYEIVSSGTLMTVHDKKVVFTIEDLRYEFIFKDNPEAKENNVHANVITNGKGLEVMFENFNNVLGAGNQEPVEMGKINEKKILFTYRVYALTGSKSKIFHYTWLLEKGGSNV